MARILLIEDEPGLVILMSDRLKAEGHSVESEFRGDRGLERGLAEPFDLLLVDGMLPGLDGVEVVSRLRQASKRAPIILVTARGQVSDRVAGLKSGADDYLVKPFAMDELVARIESQLRRQNLNLSADDGTDRRTSFGPFVFDPEQGGVFRDGERLSLTYQEFRLLQVLIEHEGRVLTSADLLDQAWGYESDVTSRTLYVHISWLRQKLKTVDRPDGYIETVRRLGYIFRT